jgi:hypothetical protein
LVTPTSSSSSSANPPTSSQQAALSIPSLTQIQGLQSLIALAQANPELLSQLTSESFFTNNTIAPSSSIDNVTANITHLSSSADALNQDIDDLGFSIEQLAQHLGFDPAKSNKQEDDLIDMDEFLNTYGKNINMYIHIYVS